MPASLLRRSLSLALVLLPLGAGCAKQQAKEAPETSLVIFAAASLRDAFGELGKGFEREHPGVALSFNFAGTQELRTQIEHGAPADVFASADQRHMTELEKAHRVAGARVFARNEPVLIVARESSAFVRDFSDLPKVDRIVVGAPEVPIGRYTLQILDRASAKRDSGFRGRVEAKIVSRELNVKQVFAKVNLGEAQAGIVYRTDVQGNDRPSLVTIPPEWNVVAEYPIAPVASCAHPQLARAWVDYVLSPSGQALLRKAGFLAPNASTAQP